MMEHLKQPVNLKDIKHLASIFISLFIMVSIPLTVFLSQQSDQTVKQPKAAITPIVNSLEELIRTRPDKAIPHEVTFPSSVIDWSWGRHGTEDTKSKPALSGTLGSWIAIWRDQSTLNLSTPVRFNIQRLAIWNHQPSNNQWVKTFDGLPQWAVNANPTYTGYTDIPHTVESDGSYSYAFTPGMILHMAQGNWPQISEGNGVAVVMEARLLGNSADITAAKVAGCSGADYRDSAATGGDSAPGYAQSGFGWCSLMTGSWKPFYMLSTTMTDAQVRANPAPSGFATTSTTAFNSVDQVIATRGDHALAHDINLPSPINTWSWGTRGTEDTKYKYPDSGSVAPWLVVFRDASVINTSTPVRFNVRRLALYNYQPSNGQWVKLHDGLPGWRVSSNPDTTSGYTDITPTVESDGSYSFAIPAGRVLHMASTSWPTITEGNGTLAIVEARILGSAGDITAAKAAVAPGADYRAAGGDFSQGMGTPGYHAASFGHFGLLTGDWKSYDILSSTLTDAQFRANYPSELSSTAVDNPPTVSITAPANGATITAGTNVGITANASDDKGISKVEISVDGAIKCSPTASPYTCAWNTTGLSGSHTISAKSYDTINQASSPSTITVTVSSTPPAPLPAPWVTGDIGSVGVAGSASYNSGVFTVSGSGDDIWNAADAFRYVYQPLNGDGTIVAKVNSQTNTDPWAKAGIMIRQDTTAGSPQAMMAVTPGNGVAFQYRSTSGAISTHVASTGTVPVWLKLQRSGTSLTGFESTDGVSFTQIGSTTIAMTSGVIIGLAVTSHNNAATSTVMFDNVGVSSGDLTSPIVNITSPTGGQTVSAAVSIAATATDNVGVSKVDFLVDGSVKGSDSTSPYNYSWDSQTVGNGSHQLTANAYDAAGNKGSTASVVAVSVSNGDTQPPSKPTNLSATATSASQVTLNWTASTDNVAVTGYWILRGGVTIATSPINSFEDRTVSPSTSYSYQVIAFDAVGNISAPSDPPVSVTTSAAPDTQTPSTPTNLTATAVSSSQINLSWTASSDNFGVTGYEVWRNGSKVATTGNVTSYGDTGLVASTTYSYFVKARDAASNVSANSSTTSATTQAPPATTGAITGTVSSSAGGVLSGARVSTVVSGSKRTVTTNSSGVYSFNFLSAGSYSLKYSAWHYVSQTQTVAVSTGTTATKNVTLQKR